MSIRAEYEDGVFVPLQEVEKSPASISGSAASAGSTGVGSTGRSARGTGDDERAVFVSSIPVARPRPPRRAVRHR